MPKCASDLTSGHDSFIQKRVLSTSCLLSRQGREGAGRGPMLSADRQDELQSKMQRLQRQEGSPSKLGKHALGPGPRERTLTLLCSAPGLHLSALGGKGWAVWSVWPPHIRFYMVSLGRRRISCSAGHPGTWPPPVTLRNPSRETSASFPSLLNDKYIPFASCLLHGQRKMCIKE